MTRLIDNFCRKHPNFGIPHLMKYLTVANIIVWIVDMLVSASLGKSILSYMAFSPALILQGQVWRLISFILIPPSTGMLAIIAFYFYYFIGNTLEANWGTAKFSLYFLTGVLLSLICGFFLYFVFGKRIALSAHYLYLSLFFSFAALFPDMQVLLFFIIPIKMKWLAIVDAVYFLIDILSLSFPVNMVPVIAILNFILFCGDDLLRLFGIRKVKRPFYESGSSHASVKTRIVNFPKSASQTQRDQKAELYHHKCSVCGKTDTDFPDLEFRFCSRCTGFHCFCQDHINSHIHFTE